ncbi:hypothetical protein E9531_02080 [Lampropedia puyangensis]|uniref:IPTL-CTERM sorting domain-containing protein n=1 Tax=Lampropedia puyangensis TaxID=1330072 RepID=A0A4S8FCL9_9BURK|nr:hypothetical protein [Lampropedia puyangensis]THU05348.1 hypothetical protein E9531_02080 [Lampropedia puyangensis]
MFHTQKFKFSLAVACLVSAGSVPAQVLLNAAGTATVPAGVHWVDVVLEGAGGSGGGGDDDNAGNGGAGAKVVATIAVQPGQLISATLGDGGAMLTNFSVGGTGGNGSGKGGNGTIGYGSGGGGGGGGGSVATVGDTVIRAGGGGGGSSYWGRTDDATTTAGWTSGTNGGDALTTVVSTANCLTAADGGVGGASLIPTDPTAVDPNGGGGGGGGGGYTGAVGAGGDGGRDGWYGIDMVNGEPGKGGTGGGSCVWAVGSNVLYQPAIGSTGAAGGIGGYREEIGGIANASATGTPGQPGSVLISVNTNLLPPRNTIQATPVPTLHMWSLLTLIAGVGMLGAIRKRHGHRQ